MPNLFHHFFLWALERRHRWDRGGGYGLVLEANGVRLEQPDRPLRRFTGDYLKAVALCDNLAKLAGVPAPLLPPSALFTWLALTKAPAAESAEWDAQTQEARIVYRRQALRLCAQDDRLILERDSELLAETELEPAMTRWIAGDEVGRAVLVTGLLWLAEQPKESDSDDDETE